MNHAERGERARVGVEIKGKLERGRERERER